MRGCVTVVGLVTACGGGGGGAQAPVQNVAPVEQPTTLALAPPVPWTLQAGPAGALALAPFRVAGQWTYHSDSGGEVETSGMTAPHTSKLDVNFTLAVTSDGKGRATLRLSERTATGEQEEGTEVEIDAGGKADQPLVGEVFALFLPVPPTGLAVGASQQRPFAYPLAMETGTVQTGTEQVTFRGYTTIAGTACAWFELHAVIEIKGGENEIHGTGTYDRHACFDPRDASLVAATIGTAEDITIVSTTTFADGESYGPMKQRRVSKLQHVLTRK